MTLAFDPYVPLWGLLVAGIISAVFVGLGIWHNWRSGALRALAVIGLIALLANPQLREAEETPLDDIALILVDQSLSQTLDGRDTTTAEAVETLTRDIEALNNVELRISEFSGAEQTRLVEALQTALADIPRARLAGVFIVTDGQGVDADDAAIKLGLEAPVHLLITGDNDETDRKITLVNAPRYGIVRQSVRVSFRVDDLGINEVPLETTGQALVTLRVDGEVVLRERVPIGTDVGFDAPLNRPGRTVIELETEPRAGELTTRNNIAVLPITAIRDRLRVLLISGEPHPGERVWRNLLKSDPAVDLVHFTILRPIEKNDGTPISELALIPFPQDELFIDKLSEFDLLIFDRYKYRGVLSSFHFDNIARFVDEGGAVLIASGPEYNSALSLASRRNLTFILPALPNGPAIEEPFRPTVTPLGDRHPVTAGLPEQDFWGRWLRIMPVLKTHGQSLMAGPDEEPLLILNRVGAGRVGLFLSDHPWLWARGFDGGGPHAELLRRIAHWLMKEPELEEEALSLSSVGDTLIIRRQSMSETLSPIILTRPDGSQTEHVVAEIEPGRFEARIDNLPRGLYRATSGDLFAIGTIGLAAPPEFQDVLSTEQKYAALTKNTGGGVFSIRRGGDEALPSIRKLRNAASALAGPKWAGIVERDSARIDSVKDNPLAPPILWLLLIGGCLLGAWMIESGRRPGRSKADQ